MHATFTDDEILAKIERMKAQRDNLMIELPFSVVQKSIRASGVSYCARDRFLFKELREFKVQSGYVNNEMTLYRSGEGVTEIVINHSQYLVIHKLFAEKEIECKKLTAEIEKWGNLIESELNEKEIGDDIDDKNEIDII